MKKWFIFAAGALFAVSACKNIPYPEGIIREDVLSLDPTEKQFESYGGSVDVTVTSYRDWTLDGTYDWVTPSVVEGKKGDVVTFAVAANTTQSPKSADFTFTSGKKEVTFTVSIKAYDPSVQFKLDLLSDDEMELPKAGGIFQIELDTELPVEILKATFSDNAELTEDNPDGWVTYRSTTENEGKVTMEFLASENPTVQARSTEITISGGIQSVKVNLTQHTTPSILTEKGTYYIDMAGGSVDVQVLSNVDFTTDFTGNAWLSIEAKDNDVYTFTASSAAPSEGRKVTVNFSSEAEGLNAAVTIVQNGRVVPNLANNRAFPYWENAAPVTSMAEFTLEAMVLMDEVKDGINTIMGIEGTFLLRAGDGIPKNVWEVVYKDGSGEQKLRENSKLIFPETGKWYHIAVAYSQANGTIHAYVNGELGASVEHGAGGLPTVNLGATHTHEERSGRCFWIGYSYTGNRYWPGKMSEVRIWNKALTAEQINEAGHFYSVAPTSEGLVAYWKMDDNTDGTPTDEPYNDDTHTFYKNIFKDYTSNGNDLTAWDPITWHPTAFIE